MDGSNYFDSALGVLVFIPGLNDLAEGALTKQLCDLICYGVLEDGLWSSNRDTGDEGGEVPSAVV